MKRSVWFLLFLYAVPLSSVAVGDPRQALARATSLIEQGEVVFARSLLEPARLHPALTAPERARAYYLRGFTFLEQGMYVSARKDFNRALEFDENHSAVLVALGDLHARGLGTVVNHGLAFRFFNKAATLGSAQGALFAGRARLLGEGTLYDVAAARQQLEQAAEADITEAALLLGASYRRPYADPPEPALALSWYERAEQAGDARAEVAIGYMLQNGELGEVDVDAACGRFAAAAEADDAAGHARYAHCLLDRDAVEARHHFQRAAAQGHTAGYLGLGYLYAQGIGVPVALDRAMSWYQRAADVGSEMGQFELARLLLDQQDEAAERRALELLADATQAGHIPAANAYAWLLATSSHAAHRNAEQAVRFAEYAVAQQRSVSHLDTLAAAYAEAGRWEEAVAVQQEAVAGDAGSDPGVALRLARYEARQPWRG